MFAAHGPVTRIVEIPALAWALLALVAPLLAILGVFRFIQRLQYGPVRVRNWAW
ncbi:MAG: hypothetical protein V4850_24300 [Myxococcota bacterium]